MPGARVIDAPAAADSDSTESGAVVIPIPLSEIRPADSRAPTEARAPAVEIPRRDDAAPSNVVPFVRPVRPDAEPAEGKSVVAPVERVIPPLPPESGWKRLLAVLIASLLLHAGLVAFLPGEPEPLPAIDLPTISVDIIVSEPPRREASPRQVEQPSPAPAEPEQPVAEARPEPTEPTTTPEEQPSPETPLPPTAVEQPAPPVAKEQAPAASAPIASSPAPMPAESAPEAESAPPAATAQPTPDAAPAPPPVERQARPEPAPKPKEPSREPKRHSEAPAAKHAPATERGHEPGEKPQRASNGQNAAPRADPNYPGKALAHLMRYIQYPSDGGGSQGTATVSFTIDGSGRVTLVRLARGSGAASLDREAQATVRRASPFPPPPDGKPRTFNAPLHFRPHG